MAGGGTGGHLFPALALVEEFRSRDADIDVVFIGGRGGLEEKIVPGCGYPLELLDVEGIKRRTGLKRIRAVLKAARATLKAIGMLRELRPDGVIGSGSYSSAPVVLAARLLGIKTAILEQNALPGLTNRILGRVVDRIYVSFEQARAFFPGRKSVFSGNPVRIEILKRAGEPKKRGRDSRFTLLVFGGSQGAVSINAAFLDATEYLTDIWNSMRVVHQTGTEGYEKVVEAYRRKGMKAEVHAFIDDMGAAYAEADLVVCRAGATSLAEITALGLAAILIPYPFASDDHQSVNARCLSESGAAALIPHTRLTGCALADEIRRLYENPNDLRSARDASLRLGKPDAARTIADNFTQLLGA